jgi:uncharacterized membrane protein
MRRFFNLVNWVLILGLVAAALWAWPHLPDRIPSHFGADGLADAWVDRTLGSWFLPPAIAVFLTAGTGWFRAMLPRHPGWVNLPDKTRVADLPEVARGPVLEMLSGFLALIQTEMLVIFTLIQLSIYRTAMGQESQGIMILVLLIAVMASPFLMVVFFLRLQTAMDRGRKLAAAAGGASED